MERGGATSSFHLSGRKKGKRGGASPLSFSLCLWTEGGGRTPLGILEGAGHPCGAPWLPPPLPLLYICGKGCHTKHRLFHAVCRHPFASSFLLRSRSSQCLGEALGDCFTTTVTTPSCCRNSSTTSPHLLDQDGEDIIKLNVCRTQRCRAFGT
jgi:hypothetical protein